MVRQSTVGLARRIRASRPMGLPYTSRPHAPVGQVMVKNGKAVGVALENGDEIRAKTGLAVEKVSSTLVMMELKGMVRHVGGMNYVAVREIQGEYEA